MVFDAHSDLLYDVTRRRLLGERRVLEHHHLDRLRRGGVEGLVLAVWASGPRETFWKDTAWKDPASNLGRTHQIFACARHGLSRKKERVLDSYRLLRLRGASLFLNLSVHLPMPSFLISLRSF